MSLSNDRSLERRSIHPAETLRADFIADLDMELPRIESMTLDVTGHYSRPDCFEFRVITGRDGSRP